MKIHYLCRKKEIGKMKEFIRGKKLLIEVAIVLHGVMELPEFCLIE